MGINSHHGNDCPNCQGNGSYRVFTEEPHPTIRSVPFERLRLWDDVDQEFLDGKEAKGKRFAHYEPCERCNSTGYEQK